jgi:hypothetical protein
LLNISKQLRTSESFKNLAYGFCFQNVPLLQRKRFGSSAVVTHVLILFLKLLLLKSSLSFFHSLIMKLISLLLLFSFLQPEILSASKNGGQKLRLSQAPAPVAPHILLRELVIDIAANKLSDIEIENKYFCTQMLHRPDEYGEKARTAATLWLADFRQELAKQRVNVADVTFPAYGDLPDETMEIMGGSQNAYVARYKGTSLRYFLLEGDKIASLLLISQGNRGFFLSLCK